MVTLGVDALLANPQAVLGDDRVGLVTNPSGVDRTLASTADRLHAHDAVDLRVLYGPEHGVRGRAQAGVDVADSVDRCTGLPVRSLYGETRRLTPAMVADVDCVVYDVQDVGSRYYTLVYTLANVLQGAAEAGVSVVVLDRPNPVAPLGVAGNRVDPAFSSFVGDYRLPVLHGLTVGELAGYIDETAGIGADLRVVPLEGWDRDSWYDETGLPWVPPSPNVPTLTTAILYPGTCLLEGTTLSEGRGTTTPFELVGAPWVDAAAWADLLAAQGLDGVAFRPAHFRPTFSKHEGENCEGVQVHLRDRDAVAPVRLGLTLLVSAFTEFEQADWVQSDLGGDNCDKGYHVDRLSGSDRLRTLVDERRNSARPSELVDEILDAWAPQTDSFRTERERYERY